MKISVFTNMMPTSSQEHMYSTVEKNIQYTIVKEMVRAAAQNRLAATSGFVPMDIGELDRMDDAVADIGKSSRIWRAAKPLLHDPRTLICG